MFRAKILQPLFEKAKTDYFRPGQAEEDVKTRFNTEYCKEYYDNYGFYDYEIWNVDYTFACFMYTHLKALIEFQENDGVVKTAIQYSDVASYNAFNMMDITIASKNFHKYFPKPTEAFFLSL